MPDEQQIKPRLTGVGSLRPELEALFASVPPGASEADYRAAVLVDNVVGRSTSIGQKWAWKSLKPRYALDMPESREFQAFRVAMADSSPLGRGYCCALMFARFDRLFRQVTLSRLSPLLPNDGTPVVGIEVQTEIELEASRAGLRWAESTVASIRRHMLSAWKDFGLVAGSKARRTKAIRPTHETTVFAATLGRLEGLTDRMVLGSRWFALLGLSEPEVMTLMYDAARAGVLGFRAQADVVEIDLPAALDRNGH